MKNQLIAQGQSVTWYNDGPAGDLPLVLLHGFCEDSSIWEDFLQKKPHLPVIRIDLPGFGDSAVPATGDLCLYADAVHAVLQAAGVQRCIMAGHSMGGYTALAFAEKHPDMLAGMALIHSHAFADSEERIEARKRGIELIRGGKKDMYVTQLFSGLFEPEFIQRDPDVLLDLINKGQQNPEEGIVRGLEAMMSRPDRCETLRGAKCPVMFLLGGSDLLVSVEIGFKSAILPPVSKVHVLPGVAHMGMFEAPDETADMLETFRQYCCGRL